MAEQLFDLFIEENNSTKSEETLVRDILTLLGDDNPRLEFKLSEALLFNNGMTAICECLTEEQARAIVEQLATLDVQCGMRPTLQLLAKEEPTETADTAIYQCPACGHQQPKLKENSGRLDACERCGIVGERYHLKKRRNAILADERHKQDMDRAQRIRETLERAKQEEETLLREEARRKLGTVKEDKPVLPWVVGFATALSLMLGVLYYHNQLTPEEVAEIEAKAAAEKVAQEEAAKKRLQEAMDKAQALVKDVSADTPTHDDSTTSTTDQPTRQVKITTALKTDDQPPANPEAVKTRHIHEETSQAAIHEIEGYKIVPPRFVITQDQHAENRRRIQQLLKLDESDLANTIIDQVKEAYPRTLLQLDIAEWQLQHAQHNKARETITHIQNELAQTTDTTQQALILGTISKAHLLLDEWDLAGASLQQAIEKTATIKNLPERLNLMIRIANEQALFGNQIAAQQVLQDVNDLAKNLPKGAEPRSSIACHLASGYAMLGDFTMANNLLEQVEDPNKKQKLAGFIDKVKYRVEQVRAEYQ